MSMNRSRRLDRRTAEEILDGAPGGRDHALNALLAAAAGAASEGGLRGEQAAVAAFRAARLAPAPRPRRRSMIKTMLAKLIAAKFAVAAAAAAAVTVGGVAAVAATGNLPGSPDSHSASTSATTAASATSSVSRMEAAESSHGGATGNEAAPSGSPTPSLIGLCHAYTAGAGSDHGKALENPAFTVLITTAGGKDKVDAYCTKVLADTDHASRGAVTTPPPAANDHPAQPHPTEGQGDTHKTVPPVTKPTHP
ncbi:hypothetical protein QRX60_28660 [Amycolatopsis mongoliensis]|uniref:Uncharacterized protein n=1 Tax=Amycolatopsis mongoliensis TaxID=715475 RepID=A0A9Y2JIR3_9PSEU|nr:hypothetical protein [Amycolatopsis sp. 4-36]WIX98043.1 hypothetical protein QRX60_28660 [Amycolatopsis sp. 4-36]